MDNFNRLQVLYYTCVFGVALRKKGDEEATTPKPSFWCQVWTIVDCNNFTKDCEQGCAYKLTWRLFLSTVYVWEDATSGLLSHCLQLTTGLQICLWWKAVCWVVQKIRQTPWQIVRSQKNGANWHLACFLKYVFGLSSFPCCRTQTQIFFQEESIIFQMEIRFSSIRISTKNRPHPHDFIRRTLAQSYHPQRSFLRSLLLTLSQKTFSKTTITVVRGDCLAVSLWAKKKNPKSNPVCLIMASSSNPGGIARQKTSATIWHKPKQTTTNEQQ